MPTQAARDERRRRTNEVLAQLDKELSEAKSGNREPDKGRIMSLLQWEIVARSEAVQSMEDIVKGALVVLHEVSSRQAGAIDSLKSIQRNDAETRKDVAALSSLLRTHLANVAQFSREAAQRDKQRDEVLERLAEQQRLQRESLHAITELLTGQKQQLDITAAAVGEIFELVGRLAAELAKREQQDSIHEEAITGVKTAVVQVQKEAESTRREVVVAKAKAFGVHALAATAGLAVWEAIQRAMGW